jgi:hypothetical protein
MTRARAGLGVLLATSLLLCACSSEGDDATEKTTLSASLTGAQVAPGPGDEDGSGDATITIGEQLGTVCYAYSVHFIEPPTAVKIGNGNPGDFGATLVTLASAPQGSPGGCVTDVDQAIIRGIKLLPASYYVEIDTASFPEGALRGQLAEP